MRTCLTLLSLLLAHASTVFAQPLPSPLPAPKPVEAVTALVEAFRTHNIVALTSPHGNEQVQSLLLSLVRDPRFPTVAQDIVVETLSARYQDLLDRFVRGDDVPEHSLRQVWEEHTVPTSIGVHETDLVRAVRVANASLPAHLRLRVLAGDPPIDWENVTTDRDHRRWIELRDSYPADLIRRQVLDRGRRALVVYGQGHLQRAMIETNYDTTAWEAQTLMTLITRDSQVRVFNVFTLLRDGDALPPTVEAWPAPSVAAVLGTSLGARDFGLYQSPIGGQRVSVRNGKFIPIPREQWTNMALERQFDAVLYLGPPRAFTSARVPAALCQDAAFMERRLTRLARAAPPIEAQRLKDACGAR
jgi:hypothetical protein